MVAVRNGRFAVTNAGDGVLMEPGAPADMILLDWGAIDGCFLLYRRSKRSPRLTIFPTYLVVDVFCPQQWKLLSIPRR